MPCGLIPFSRAAQSVLIQRGGSAGSASDGIHRSDIQSAAGSVEVPGGFRSPFDCNSGTQLRWLFEPEEAEGIASLMIVPEGSFANALIVP